MGVRHLTVNLDTYFFIESPGQFHEPVAAVYKQFGVEHNDADLYRRRAACQLGNRVNHAFTIEQFMFEKWVQQQQSTLSVV